MHSISRVHGCCLVPTLPDLTTIATTTTTAAARPASASLCSFFLHCVLEDDKTRLAQTITNYWPLFLRRSYCCGAGAANVAAALFCPGVRSPLLIWTRQSPSDDLSVLFATRTYDCELGAWMSGKVWRPWGRAGFGARSACWYLTCCEFQNCSLQAFLFFFFCKLMIFLQREMALLLTLYTHLQAYKLQAKSNILLIRLKRFSFVNFCLFFPSLYVWRFVLLGSIN